MEIQVKSPTQGPPTRRFRPLPDPLILLAKRELVLFHSDCGGRVSVDSDDANDFDAYATVRCNLCFETNRERQSSIARALTEVLVEGRRSTACTILTFVPLNPREMLSHNPLASRLGRFFRSGPKKL